MEQYTGIDVSLEYSSICIVDARGKVLKEAQAASEPEALIAWFAAQEVAMARIGLEAGPLSQWLFAEMKAAGLAVELIETRHVSSRRCQSRRIERTHAASPSSCGLVGFARYIANRCLHRRSVHS